MALEKRRKESLKGRPWSFNGAHIILKEYPQEISLSEVSFATTTFTIQVHGLPLVFIHAGTTEKIDNRIRVLQQDPITKKCVVANSYLRFRVDIQVNNPIPVGFFQE